MAPFKQVLAALPMILTLGSSLRCEDDRRDLRIPRLVSPPGVKPIVQGLALDSQLQDVVHRLTARLQNDAPFDEDDIREAEELARHGGENAMLRSLAVVSLRAAARARAPRDFNESLRLLDLATTLDADGIETRLQKVELLLDHGEWYEAEAAARRALTADPENAAALLGLGYALLRQDHTRESAEILARCLAIRDDAVVRALHTRVQETLSRENNLTEEQLPRFNLRYDGQIHEAIGQQVLTRLEELYSILVAHFEHEPLSTIPVTLFSRKRYHADRRVPEWSGGAFDTFDGRIRVAVDELSAMDVDRLVPMLTHELTHVIVHDLARGSAPWEIQEGLAQHMEGKRAGESGQPSTYAQARPEVHDAYLSALAWVEHLLDLGGQQSLNATLWQAGQTGVFNKAFQDVFGFDYKASHAAFEIQRAGPRRGPAAVDPDGR
jgi:hypothetical protein